MINLFLRSRAIFILLLGILITPIAQATPGDLITTFNINAHSFVEDRNTNIVYASVTSNNSVAVIDMNSLEQIDSIVVGSAPRGMATSRDGNLLYVATAGASSLAVVDLQTRTLLDPILLPTSAQDVEVDAKGRIYAAPASTSFRSILIHDPATNQTTEQLSYCSACYSSLLEMSKDGNTLYIANRGLSPGTIAKYDVSGVAPVLLWQNAHGALGSNGQDLWLTPTNDHIYYAVGGGNNIAFPYDIAQIDADTMSVLGSFGTGAYPREIITSPDGKTAYAVHTSGHIDVWDAETFIKISEYPTSGEATELFTDSTGNYLLAAFATELRIYEAEGSIPLVDNDQDGIEDSADNCLGINNPAQLDADKDGIGDACDPFPNSNNHAYAQCSIELGSSQDEISALQAALADSDHDGVIDSYDQCASSTGRVDAKGCTQAQFCSSLSYSNCRYGDWKNDEPRRARDCKWENNQCRVRN